MPDVTGTVLRVVAETAGKAPGDLAGATRLSEDLKLKSVDRIAISARVSAELGVEINMFEILKVKSVDDVAALARGKLEK